MMHVVYEIRVAMSSGILARVCEWRRGRCFRHLAAGIEITLVQGPEGASTTAGLLLADVAYPLPPPSQPVLGVGTRCGAGIGSNFFVKSQADAASRTSSPAIHSLV